MKQNKALYLSAALLISIFILSFLSSCNDDRKCESIIIHEDFTPIGLPQRAHMLCFESDSIGYAATPILEDINGRCHIEESVISKTVDRGRTWNTLGKVDGKCINISEYGQRIFVTTTNQFQRNQEQGGMKSEIWVISKDAFFKTRIAQEGDNIFGIFSMIALIHIVWPIMRVFHTRLPETMEEDGKRYICQDNLSAIKLLSAATQCSFRYLLK